MCIHHILVSFFAKLIVWHSYIKRFNIGEGGWGGGRELARLGHSVVTILWY